MVADATKDLAPANNLASWSPWKLYSMFFVLYLSGIMTFLVMIAEPFTMSTYFSDNSLLPGLVNREFAYTTEAEYYLKSLDKLAKRSSPEDANHLALATLPGVVNYIKNELDNFGVEFYEQNFNFMLDGKQLNGTNVYSFVRGERSTSSEAIVLCVPYVQDSQSSTMPSVALSLALAKYFSTKSYWAKDVIVLFVDQYEHGLSTWLDSYHDVRFKTDFNRRLSGGKDGIYYDQLQERSGPIQAAIVLELKGRQFSRINIKIQGQYGQLPNLDLFNLVAEMAPRESITPYFYNKSLPFGMSDLELYQHHLETTLEFMRTQATMRSDGLHGLFLSYAIQALTIEAPEHDKSDRNVMVASLNNAGRLIEAIFRSLNNLTERFNRSFYFYILVSLRRFTSIGYYMVPFGLILSPILMRAYAIHLRQARKNRFIGVRAIILLASALVLSLISTFNISLALAASVGLVPILLIL